MGQGMIPLGIIKAVFPFMKTEMATALTPDS